MEFFKSYITPFLHFLVKQSKELRENKDVFIFSGFLFLAACFWVLNALQKDNYTNDLTYPIRYSNSTSTELIQGNLTNELTIRLRGSGFSLLRYQVNNSFIPIVIDIKGLNRYQKKNEKGAYVVTRDYKNIISSQLINDAELMSVSPDTLYIPLISKKEKKVPIVQNIEVQFDHQSQLADNIILNPDSIMISGPEWAVDSINQVFTKEYTFSKLKDTVSQNLDLITLENINFSTSQTNVTIPVEQFTEANQYVPIETIGLPKELALKTFPTEVKVSYHVGLSKPIFRPSDFSAQIDLSGHELDKLPSRLKVKLNKQPEIINAVTYSPVFVEYLIEKVQE